MSNSTKIKISFFWNKLFILLIIFSSFILSCAYFIDYYLGYEPCILCIYQRYPYFAIIFFSFLGIFLKKFRVLLLVSVGLCVIIEGGVAVYHTGVERNLWSPTSECASDIKISQNESIEDFLNKINNTPISDCRKPAIKILGFSLAELNILLSIIFLFTLIYIYKKYEEA